MIGLFTFLMGLVFIILVLAGGLRWIDSRGRVVDSGARDLRPKLDRLEDALGRLEARVDDLQDQQRFLERLLSEREATNALPPGTEDGEAESEPEGRPASDSILFDLDRDDEGVR